MFDDFIAAAEWLIANKYTQPPKLAIRGGSNGGLLVGAVHDAAPGAVRRGAAGGRRDGHAALPQVHASAGRWATEYGSSDDPEQFQYLRAYSPLHNVEAGHAATRPTLITTADHDDRVVPGHSFKFAAALQAAQAGDAPVLIRIETRTGHGMGRPIDKKIELAADSLAFIHQSLGMNLDDSMTRTITHLIGGQPHSGDTERRAPVWNPATGEQQAWVSLASAADIDRAVKSSDSGVRLVVTDFTEPADAHSVAFRELVNARRREIAEAISDEHGKVVTDAEGEVQRGHRSGRVRVRHSARC